MIDSVKNIFAIPDLRKRVLFTLMILGIYRVGSAIPTPGVNTEALRLLVERGTPLYALRSDSAAQMEKFLRDHLSEEFPEDRAA